MEEGGLDSRTDDSTGSEADYDEFSGVLPVAHRLSYMKTLHSLRPQTFTPLSPYEEARLPASFTDIEDNPFIRRMRRRLLLRQTKRAITGGSGLIFCLERRTRQMLREVKPGQLRLIDLFSRKTIQNYLQELSNGEIASVAPTEVRRKGRRPRDYQNRVDQTRAQSRRLRSQEGRASLLAIQRKHELVKDILRLQRQQIENETQQEVLQVQAMQSHATPWQTSLEDSVSLGGEESGIASDLNFFSSWCGRDASPSDRSLLSCTRTLRYSLSSVVLPSDSGNKETRQQRLSRQAKELDARRRAVASRSSKDSAGSAEMEQHLLRTIEYVETVFDPSLDPTGQFWSFEEQLFGDIREKRATTPIISLWSGRVIKPSIWRDYETEPPKLKLLLEIQRRAHSISPSQSISLREPLQYRYLQPHTLPQVKKLLQDLLWPNIDVSESLLYPEHTVVAVYRELVVGCGFITNFGYIIYLCVHPEWQNSGIGTFMMYHLIQTCPHKDITLHVSANNMAVILYQKFSFKIDEYIVNFYEKFLPSHSRLSKNAFFMRLRK